MKKLYLLLFLLGGGLLIWRPWQTHLSAPTPQKQESLPRVQVQAITPQHEKIPLVLQGLTEGQQKVTLKAEEPGRISKLHVERGKNVKEGDLLLSIDPYDRLAQLKGAQAAEKQAQLDFYATQKLWEKKFKTPLQLALSQAKWDQAKATLEKAQVTMDHMTIKAPFKGTFDFNMVQEGDFVDKGTPLGTVISLDPLRIVVYVSSQEVFFLKEGSHVKLIGLQQDFPQEGKVSYISRIADASTKTYRVDIQVGNPHYLLPEGLSVTLSIPLHEADVYTISPSAISLNDEGITGIKVVDDHHIVHFIPCTIISGNTQSLKISGPQGPLKLILTGHAFVMEGQKVHD